MNANEDTDFTSHNNPPIKSRRRGGSMTRPERGNMVLERPLVLEIRPANTEPPLAAVLLVGSPVALDGQALAAFATRVSLRPVFSLVMSLQCPEILKRLSPRVVYVVLAPFFAAVAWDPHHRPRLLSL